MNVILLDCRNRELGIYPDHLAELLERQPRSDAGTDELDRLHRERRWLLCKCGRVLHVVQREFPFLRRNPGQGVDDKECGLCKGSREYGAQIEGTGEARHLYGIGFVLGTRIHLEVQPAEPTDWQETVVRRSGFKYARGFGILFTLIDRAGFTSLSSTLPWSEMWKRIYDQLKNTPLHPNSNRSFADFSWMPGGFYRGGLRDLNTRMLEDWDHSDIRPECWVFSMIPEMPSPDNIPIYLQSTSMRRTADQRGETIYPPYRIEVPVYCTAPIGLSGPFLALAVGSATDKGPPKFRKPRFHRLLMQAVASEHCPVPCDSSYERSVVELLQKRGIAFVKPVFDNDEGLRPDFILPGNKVLIEVQGRTSEEYRERKCEIHQRMRESQEYRDYELITFDVNDGETMAVFEKRLLSII